MARKKTAPPKGKQGADELEDLANWLTAYNYHLSPCLRESRKSFKWHIHTKLVVRLDLLQLECFRFRFLFLFLFSIFLLPFPLWHSFCCTFRVAGISSSVDFVSDKEEGFVEIISNSWGIFATKVCCWRESFIKIKILLKLECLYFILVIHLILRGIIRLL